MIYTGNSTQNINSQIARQTLEHCVSNLENTALISRWLQEVEKNLRWPSKPAEQDDLSPIIELHCQRCRSTTKGEGSG